MAQFATTRWSQVLVAAQGADASARDALEALCQAYWYPLYAYVRRQGHDPDSARDLTQAFFGHLLEKDLLQVADPDRGRFRSFLLTSLKNFLAHERERDAALKRGGGTTTLSLDAVAAEGRFDLEPSDELTPDVLFERRWALTIMERAMSALAEQAAASDHPERFSELKKYLTGSEPRLPYKEAAQALNMSEANVRVAIHRLRNRYGELLRQQIAETVAEPGQVDDELRHLLTTLGAA